MSLSSQYKTNQTKAIEGVAITFPSNEDGTVPTFYVSRMNDSNPQYAAKLAAVTKPFKRQIDAGTLPQEKAKELTKDVFTSTVLKGWENIPMSDVTGVGSDTGYASFSKATALQLFENLPDLYSELVTEASGIARFLADELEAEAKN